MADSKISALTSYTTPLDADVVPVVDTANTTTKKTTWANLKATLKTYFDTVYTTAAAVAAAYQPLDADLTTIAGLTATTNNFIVSVSSAWASRTPTQVKTTLSLDNVDNTSDSTKNAATVTLTNKRINKRIGTETSSATSTPTADSVDQWNVTALAVADAFAAPTGTPVDGQDLVIRIKDAGAAKALTWNAIYRASTDLALPSTTIISKTLYLGFRYNAADSKWDLLAVLNNF